ncbi:hypothetical protein [Streptomyces sp. C10-9-1]|uniref:hypothetical protein n=1 Tax=Streptomyces sp. C10-9-1 TaxID=1859285 RepID=UPI003F4A073D
MSHRPYPNVDRALRQIGRRRLGQQLHTLRGDDVFRPLRGALARAATALEQVGPLRVSTLRSPGHDSGLARLLADLATEREQCQVLPEAET